MSKQHVKQAYLARRQKHKNRAILWSLCVAVLYLGSARLIEFDFDAFVDALPHLFDYFIDISPHLELSKLFSPRDPFSHAIPGSLIYWGYRLPIQLRLIWETLNMAFAATLVSATLSLCFSFLCTRNMGVWTPVRLVLRTCAIFMRTMPELAWAIMLVMAFGVGPFPGFLALVLHTTGCMVKLYYEALESTSQNTIIGLSCSGANKLQLIRFAYWPAFKPTFISYFFLRLEVNFRASSILGIVGAGGIGQELMTNIKLDRYDQVSMTLLLILVVVWLLDLTSAKIQAKIVQRGLN